MKLEKILDQLNSFEKNGFLKIIDSICADKPKNSGQIEKILSDSSRDFKNMDNINVSIIWTAENEFAEFLRNEFANTTSQLDILTDILIRDGNCIMKQDWFTKLYEKELLILDKEIKEFLTLMDKEQSEISDQRKRDYKTYLGCLRTAYDNDLLNNQEQKITSDERSILVSLANLLGLSQEEVKLINYSILPRKKIEIESLINELRAIGVIFYSKKNSTLYVADEMVRILRKVRNKEVPDKYFRRILRLFREPQINLICKKHRIDWRLPLEQKIKEIIKEGVSFTSVLMDEVHKEGTNVSDKKKFINELCDMGLRISPPLKGVLIDEKIANLIKYFEEIELDEKVGISIDGYEKLLMEMSEILPKLNEQVKSEFELQEDEVLKSNYFLDSSIKPRDVLEIISEKELDSFCSDENN